MATQMQPIRYRLSNEGVIYFTPSDFKRATKAYIDTDFDSLRKEVEHRAGEQLRLADVVECVAFIAYLEWTTREKEDPLSRLDEPMEGPPCRHCGATLHDCEQTPGRCCTRCSV